VPLFSTTCVLVLICAKGRRFIRDVYSLQVVVVVVVGIRVVLTLILTSER